MEVTEPNLYFGQVKWPGGRWTRHFFTKSYAKDGPEAMQKGLRAAIDNIFDELGVGGGYINCAGEG